MRYIDFALSEKVDHWLNLPDKTLIHNWLDNIPNTQFKGVFNELRIDTQLSLKAYLSAF
jgi:hypothetical protein